MAIVEKTLVLLSSLVLHFGAAEPPAGPSVGAGLCVEYPDIGEFEQFQPGEEPEAESIQGAAGSREKVETVCS